MVEDKFVLLISVTQDFSCQTLFVNKYSSIINNGKGMLYFFKIFFFHFMVSMFRILVWQLISHCSTYQSWASITFSMINF